MCKDTEALGVTLRLSIVLVTTSNLRKAHVTRDSSDPATSATRAVAGILRLGVLNKAVPSAEGASRIEAPKAPRGVGSV